MNVLKRKAPRKRGRPTNQTAYTQMLLALKNKPRTILELAEELAIPKRTVYRYIHKAAEEGYGVVKLGVDYNAPYTIKSQRAIPTG